MLSSCTFLHAHGFPTRRAAYPGRFSKVNHRALCGRLASKKDRPEEGGAQDGGDEPNEKVDIDVLAQKLSEMAGKLREQEKLLEQREENAALADEKEGIGEVWEEETARFELQVGVKREVELEMFLSLGIDC